MAKPQEPTIKVKLEPDTADFEAKLAEFTERARKALLLPNDLLDARIEALRAALAVHTHQPAKFTPEDVVAAAEKFNAFLLGNEHAQHVHYAPQRSVSVVGGGVAMHAEQSAQAYLAKHTGL